jgi:aminopeptidase-like protein
MRSVDLSASEAETLGRPLHDLCGRLFPICRSITGDGVRETLRILQDWIPVELHEVPSGTQVLDWEVPLEWNLRAAYVENEQGERVIDAARHNLHVLGYSTPVDAVLSREELDAHLFSLPDQPDLIPYRTSYYAPKWGFCLPHRQREALPPGNYRAVIDSSLGPGSLTYGEFFIPGQTQQELLISTHVCHPSLANDNLSGISVATYLAQHFRDAPLRYGIRFVFVPATIGAITWLARNEHRLDEIVGGLVISGVGDAGPFTYKRSRSGSGVVDRIFGQLLGAGEGGRSIRPFIPYGYDERQYCSPGIGIAAGCLMRTPFGEYPEYHTSGDNLDLISAKALGEALNLCVEAITRIQSVGRYRNMSPKGEPQLGRRGLYDMLGGDNDTKLAQLALLWMLNYSDGSHSTLDISDLSGLDLAILDLAAQRLSSAGLLSPLPLPRSHKVSA